MHLKDLILLNTALGDKVEGELVNFRKMVQLSLTFTQLMQVATSTLPVEVNMDLVNTIRVSESLVKFCQFCLKVHSIVLPSCLLLYKCDNTVIA